MASNIIPLDPVQGFVDYVQDIKPYHSKILEVLIEYVTVDEVQVTIDDAIEWNIGLSQPVQGCAIVLETEKLSVSSFGQTEFVLSSIAIPADPGNLGLFRVFVNGVQAAITVTTPTSFTIDSPTQLEVTDFITAKVYDTGSACPLICGTGYGSLPYGGSLGYPITADDVGLSTVTIPGDVENDFPVGSPIKIVSQVVDEITEVVNNTEINFYNVVSATVTPATVGSPPSTTFTLSPALTPLLTPGVGEVAVATFYYEPLPIVGVIPVDDQESALLDVGSNMFVVAGLFTTRFRQGTQFDVDGGDNDGRYTVLYSDFVAGQTRIRVKEPIRSLVPGGLIKPIHYGYDYVEPLCTPYDMFVNVCIDEKLTMSSIDLTFIDEVVVYNLENTEEEGYDTEPYSDVLAGYALIPNHVYHGVDSVNVDVVNNAFEISGGNYQDRFLPELEINGFNITSPIPGNLLIGPFQSLMYPIVSVDTGTDTISIAGDLTWLYLPNRQMLVQYYGDVDNHYTIVSSAFDGTNTNIVVSVTPEDRNGSVSGAVFEPASLNSLDNPLTVVAVSPPEDVTDDIADVESIGYVRPGPYQIKIESVEDEPCSVQVTDAAVLDFIDVDLFIASSLWDVAGWDEGAWDADYQEFAPREVDSYQAGNGETEFILSDVVKDQDPNNVLYVLVDGIVQTFTLDPTGTVVTLDNPVVVNPDPPNTTFAIVTIAYIVAGP